MGAPALSVQGAGDFTIRPAEFADAEKISTVIIDSAFDLKEIDFRDGGWERFLEQVRPSKVAELISDPSFHLAVATLDGTIVGMVTVKNRSRIYQFFVGRAHAGEQRLYLHSNGVPR